MACLYADILIMLAAVVYYGDIILAIHLLVNTGNVCNVEPGLQMGWRAFVLFQLGEQSRCRRFVFVSLFRYNFQENK